MRGLSLIEVLVSFALLSLMLLYLGAAQVQSLKRMKMEHYFNTAIQQLLNANEILQADQNVDSILLQQWQKQLRDVLPQGVGSVTTNADQNTIIVSWGNKTLQCNKNQLQFSYGCLHSEIPLYLRA